LEKLSELESDHLSHCGSGTAAAECPGCGSCQQSQSPSAGHNCTAIARIGWRTDAWHWRDYLQKRSGKVNLYVLRRSAHNKDSLYGQSTVSFLTTFERFLEEMTRSSLQRNLSADPRGSVNAEPGSDDEFYLNVQQEDNVSYQRPLGPVQADIPMPFFVTDYDAIRNGSGKAQVNLWMVAAGSDEQSQPGSVASRHVRAPVVSRLHHDALPNLVGIVKGRKRYVVFSPQDALNVYTLGAVQEVTRNGNIKYGQSDEQNPHFAIIDTDHIDLDEFPLYTFAEERRGEFTIDEGEMLFLPHGWFHQVTSVGDSIAVNHWFYTGGDDPYIEPENKDAVEKVH